MYLYLSRHNNTINKKKAIEKLFVFRKVSDKGKTLNPNTLFFVNCYSIGALFCVSILLCREEEEEDRKRRCRGGGGASKVMMAER
jgi:hypothetical protein